MFSYLCVRVSFALTLSTRIPRAILYEALSDSRTNIRLSAHHLKVSFIIVSAIVSAADRGQILPGTGTGPGLGLTLPGPNQDQSIMISNFKTLHTKIYIISLFSYV